MHPEAQRPAACPETTHLFAAAQAPTSRADAEASARAALIKQLRSRVQVEVDRVLTATTTDDGGAKVNRSLAQSVKETADFDHGELLFVSDAVSTDSQHYVGVCLERAAAADAVLGASGEAPATFAAATDEATSAIDSGNTRAFTEAYRRAQHAAPGALSTWALLAAVRGQPSAEEAEAKGRWQTMIEEATRVRSKASLQLFVDAAAFDSEAAQVTEHFRACAESTGLPVVIAPDADACPARAYAIRVAGKPGCKWGGLGHVCKPTFELLVRACAGDGRNLLRRTIAGGSGADSSDKGKALRTALRGFDREATASAIKQVIEAELPPEGS